MRHAFSLLVVLLYGCGGGGSSEGSGPPVQGLPATYGIAGNVVTSSGAGLNGVPLQLAGATSATTTSAASGAFQFSGVPDGAYTVTPNSASGPFTPIGVAVTVAGQSIAGVTFTQAAPAASMQQISDFFASSHASWRASFTTAETALGNQLAAQGRFYSGAHYSMSRTNLTNATSAFTGAALSQLRAIARSATLDRVAVAALFSAYAQRDADFVASYYGAAGWGLSGSGLSSFIADTSAQTNGIYASAISQIP